MAKTIMPTLWQSVILKNYGKVQTEKIAKIINCDEQTVIKNAKDLGLNGVEFSPLWVEKGFVSIIRNNWDILTKEDIAFLLDKSLSEFETLLTEYDFLSIKLGEKLKEKDYKYYPLSQDQIEQTKKIKTIIEDAFATQKVQPFDFFSDYIPCEFNLTGEYQIQDAYTSCYSADFTGALLDDDLKDFDIETLNRIKQVGINGIWLHESLKNLAEFPFDKSYSKGYQKRVKNLNKLVERAEKFGIGVYIYLNEPRSMKEEFFDKYPEIKGQQAADGTYCMCTSSPIVQKYLYDAVKSLAVAVPRLKGIMTITMSENPTHCYSRQWQEFGVMKTDCPRCSLHAPEEISAEVNNIIYRALKDGNGYTRLIANLWSWNYFSGWTKEQTLKGVDLLEDGIDVLCVSEFSKDFVRGGVNSIVADYSISVVGPSDLTVKVLKRAKEKGHRIWAKIQANNSWECSAVPYIPAFDLMVEHVKNLKALGVSGLMMGWSLGGYPGGALPLLNALRLKEDIDIDLWYKSLYGDNFKIVRKAVKEFSVAFSNFPFSIESLYFGGQTLGCANLWNLEKDCLPSTMVCFGRDDYEVWAKPYGIDTYIDLMESVALGFEKGLKILPIDSDNKAVNQLKNVAEAVYLHIKSTALFASFCKNKSDIKQNKEILIDCVKQEIVLTKRLIKLISEDALIGFEMTNHYYYNQNVLFEKLLNLEYLLEKI